MKTLKFTLLIFLSTCLFLAGCGDQPVNNNVEEEISLEAEESNFSLDHLAPSKEELRELFHSPKAKRKQKGGITHYQFDVRLGPGPFDVVRIHRVVKERRSNRPVRTRGAVFMTHGASLNFEAIFLNAGSDNPTPETSAALYLAANNIDVWGMDYAWTLVPEETSEFSFMKDWGAEKDAKHTLAAMSIARFLRGLSGQGFGRLNLLGYSYGAALTYVAAGLETQQHRFLRDISGIIPVDITFKVPDPENSPSAPCAVVKRAGNNLENENYVNPQGQNFKGLGQLAANAPDTPSPLPPFEGLTNYQAALAAAMFPGGGRPYWHFLAGEVESGLPVGLQFTDPARWIGLLVSLPPYIPFRPGYEIGLAGCENEDTAIDDHLTKISVPILYLGAGGGFGTEGNYTANLTNSDDITTHTVSLNNNPVFDFGHADLFLADNAPNLVWEELRRWLVDHADRKRKVMTMGNKNKGLREGASSY